MHPAVWNTSTDPDRMFAAAADYLSDRKLLLFGCACARRVWGLVPELVRPAIPRIEGAAEVRGQRRRQQALWEAVAGSVGSIAGWVLPMLQPQLHLPGIVRYATNILRCQEWGIDLSPDELAATEYLNPLLNFSPRRDHPEQAALLRCIAGYPLDPPAFDPAWQTSDAVSLAGGIYAEQAFDRLPILADALMDAGCSDDQILSHVRSAGPHVRGCWVVDLVLGKT
jgi:hypothetical protein